MAAYIETSPNHFQRIPISTVVEIANVGIQINKFLLNMAEASLQLAEIAFRLQSLTPPAPPPPSQNPSPSNS
jgi:hypothetical protein